MDSETILGILIQYKTDLERILRRFERSRDGIHIAQSDDPVFRQKVLEIMDFLNDCFGSNNYVPLIADRFNAGISNFSGSPSYKSAQDIVSIVGAVLTRLKRNPSLLDRRKAQMEARRRENVFIIHGRDEAKWRELKEILRDSFRLSPIVLEEQPDAGCQTVIEKFEHYARQCGYAIAVFTPDDEVTSHGESYLQARPNVIYELGWFCGRLERTGVMLLLKEGTSLFSDFGGILQKRFQSKVAEILLEIKRDLVAAGIVDDA